MAHSLEHRQAPAHELPTGTLTFLLTDAQSSARLWEQYPDAMRAATRRHDELIEQKVADCGGVLVRPRGEGDSRFAVFSYASTASPPQPRFNWHFTMNAGRYPSRCGFA